jgi:hypothetical protein
MKYTYAPCACLSCSEWRKVKRPYAWSRYSDVWTPSSGGYYLSTSHLCRPISSSQANCAYRLETTSSAMFDDLGRSETEEVPVHARPTRRGHAPNSASHMRGSPTPPSYILYISHSLRMHINKLLLSRLRSNISNILIGNCDLPALVAKTRCSSRSAPNGYISSFVPPSFSPRMPKRATLPRPASARQPRTSLWQRRQRHRLRRTVPRASFRMR